MPQRTVVPDGIGDYATLLAGALDRHAGLSSIFVQGTVSEIGPPRKDLWPTIAVPAHSQDGLLSTLTALAHQYRPVALVLHISLYGYEKRGVPMWFLRGLKTWKQLRKSGPIVAIFHELWAGTANPLKSSFWVSPAQRYLIRSLYNLADATIATTEVFRRMLEKIPRKAGVQIAVANVFSTMGEPASFPTTGERPLRLMVFGRGVAGLARTPGFDRLLQVAAVEEIIEVGKQIAPQGFSVCGIPVAANGVLPAPEVSKLLLTCQLGILPYGNRAVFGKSSILAAYAAHGVVPVALEATHEASDGLIEGVHYVTSNEQPADVGELEAVQRNIHCWYTKHSLATQAKQVAKLIRSIAF